MEVWWNLIGGDNDALVLVIDAPEANAGLVFPQTFAHIEQPESAYHLGLLPAELVLAVGNVSSILTAVAPSS